MNTQACVIDIGTGYTKLGFSGNSEPQFIMPTTVGMKYDPEQVLRGPSSNVDPDLDVVIGDKCFTTSAANYTVKYPVQQGCVDNWSSMETFLHSSIYEYMNIRPGDHFFLMTEPPLNPPENREYLGEIMFETFNIPGLYIAVQAVLALAASWPYRKSEERSLTGMVLDSGDGLTHAVPVAEGFVIGSCIKQIPVAGRNVTRYIQTLLRERDEPVPPEMSSEVAKEIKEKYCYVCPDITKEFDKYSASPEKWLKVYNGINNITQKPFSIDIGFERFMAPEVYFRPGIENSQFDTSLANVIDDAIQACPIDVKRDLYSNIVLSGGSTMFKDFGRRLQRDIKRITDNRHSYFTRQATEGFVPKPTEVVVCSHKMQRYAVWFGGSIYATTESFYRESIKREDYLERGASICRQSPIFNAF
uniref:Actin-related protein 3 n=1 Tax=Panagrellus redivivus TaxID=6233 RepID=A0A7E4UZ41_PANRE